MKKILVFNPFGIGDVLFTTPMAAVLKRRMPDTSIHYVCSKRAYPIVRYNALFSKVFVYEKDDWRDTLTQSKIAFARRAWAFFSEIRSARYDCVFDLSMNAQYGFFFLSCRIPVRIGYNFKKRGKFLTQAVDITHGYCDRHVARYCLGLLPLAGFDAAIEDEPMSIDTSAHARARVKEIFLARNIDVTRPIAVVFPGAGDSWGKTAYFKRWPEESFAALARHVASTYGMHVLVCGSTSEEEVCRRVAELAGPTTHMLAGCLNLEELVAALEMCSLVVANDGGPFHIAQALDKKTIGLFGPVDERVYGVYPESPRRVVLTADVPCRPCYHAFKFPECRFDKRCLREITVERVLSAIAQIL